MRRVWGAGRGAGAREEVRCVDGDAEALLDCVGADVGGAGGGEVVTMEDYAGVHEEDHRREGAWVEGLAGFEAEWGGEGREAGAEVGVEGCEGG